MMVWGEDAEVKVLEDQNKICSAMYDEEKNDYRNISPDVQQEIAETTQLTKEDVMDMIQKYKQMKGFHEYLLKKKANNEPMPESRDELMQMYRIERPSFLMSKRPRGGSKKR